MKYSRVKDFTVIINGVGVNPEVQGNPFGEIPFFRNSDFSKEGNELYLQNSESNFSFEEIKQYGFRLAPKNSLVFSKVGESIRKNHRKFTKNISVIDNNLSAFLINKKINKQYFYWFFKTIDFANYLVPSTIPVLNTSLVKNIVVPQYSPPQQTAIANYLDHHTTKIDKEISLLEKKVEKLDEYKQALIYETVTKGLDKNVPMKDSCIEWIGTIPAHWEVKRVKEILQIYPTRKIKNPETSQLLSLTTTGIKIKDKDNYSGKMADNFDNYQIVYKNEIVLCLFDLDITAVISGVSKFDGMISPAYTTASETKYTDIKFIHYLIWSWYKNKTLLYFARGLRNTYQQNTFSNILIGIPTKNEQKQIAEYLDGESLKIDKKKFLINKKIELLKEYKQSLIYEAVTGKMEII